MKDVFSYTLPKKYKTGEDVKYCLPKGGDKMKKGSLNDMKSLVTDDMCKEACTWGQLFVTGKRVTKDNLKWEDWNGFTFADIDSKHYYNECKKFNPDALLTSLNDIGEAMYWYNYFCIYKSNSGTSYRVFFYWTCDRTEENFKKCTVLTKKYIKEMFYSIGSIGKEIIEWPKVLDKCSASIYQGFYVTLNDIHYSSLTDDDNFGLCDLTDVSIDELNASSTVTPIVNNVQQYDFVSNVKWMSPKDKSIDYYPHSWRRCVYESLIVMFKDKNIVDDEYNKVCEMYVEGNGHNVAFFKKEPDKNKWFDRFNTKIYHNLHWVKPFGYTFDDKSEYVYIKQFVGSWKKHILHLTKKLYISIYDDVFTKDFVNTWKMMHKGAEPSEKEIQKALDNNYEKMFNQLKEITSPADRFFENVDKKLFMDSDEDEKLYNDYISKLSTLRCEYYKTRWNRKDWKYLCDGYEIAKDAVTYKMYADFYYRDDNNVSLLSYDVLADNIYIKNKFDSREMKFVDKTVFKFGDEYTHWKNSDEFSTLCSKELMRDSVLKYVRRNFPYNPIKQYLLGLTNINTDVEKLETFLIRHLQADDTELNRTMTKNFFIAAVKKQLSDKMFVFPHMLFIQGATNTNKTYLLMQMFTVDNTQYIINDIHPDDSDSKIAPLVNSAWMVQFGESSSLKKVDANTQKEFVDRINAKMSYQKKYENEVTECMPRVVVTRTSNDDTLFNDVSIDEGDKRNWLIVSNAPAYSTTVENRKAIEDEKDLIWATAVKLYLDNPDMDLELEGRLFKELNNVQENFKLVKNEDIKELYDSIFERQYIVDGNKFFIDMIDFVQQQSRSNEYNCKNLSQLVTQLDETNQLTNEILGHSAAKFTAKIDVLPSNWLKNGLKLGNFTLTKLKNYMKNQGWYNKNVRYNGNTMRCWVK